MDQGTRDAAGTEPASEPAWEIAHLFPDQGQWSEEDYLSLDTNRLVELSDGRIEVLPMPTMAHQDIVLFLCDLLRAFVRPGRLGRVMIAPFPIRLGPKKFREPDVMFMLAAHVDRISNACWQGADLVIEVVSDNDRRRDLVEKRAEYARAGIAEYWIVDPKRERITVLTLAGDAYAVHGEFAPGDRAASALLPGFEVDVAAALAGAI